MKQQGESDMLFNLFNTIGSSLAINRVFVTDLQSLYLHAREPSDTYEKI